MESSDESLTMMGNSDVVITIFLLGCIAFITKVAVESLTPMESSDVPITISTGCKGCAAYIAFIYFLMFGRVLDSLTKMTLYMYI